MIQRAASILSRRPATCGVAISCIKTSAADLIIQTTVEQKTEIDWNRNAVFASFGACYLGGVQYVLYCRLFPRLFPKSLDFASLTLKQKMLERSGQMQVFAQTCVDQFLHIPFVYFPCFYLLKASIEAKSLSIDVARDALHCYLEVAPNDNMAQWAFFVPAATLNFGFSPMHLRVPVVAGVSFLWTMLLSYRRGGRATSEGVLMDKASAE